MHIMCNAMVHLNVGASQSEIAKKYHRRWRQHRAITVNTVDTVDNVDTVDTIDTVDSVDTVDTVDTVRHSSTLLT